MQRGGRPLRVVFAGDRDIAVRVFRFLARQPLPPVGLMLPAPERASHAASLRALAGYLDETSIISGDCFRTPEGIETLKSLNPDYILSVHFPYIIPESVLDIPRCGVLNLHPAYLPYNRGWHTPSWAIWEGTPYGATLHFMDAGLDSGDIVRQARLEVRPDDTANSLYRRVKILEYRVFREAWPLIASGDFTRTPQPAGEGTLHKKSDLAKIQPISLDDTVTAEDLLRRLRALTTSRSDEAAYFIRDGKKYRVRVEIQEEAE